MPTRSRNDRLTCWYQWSLDEALVDRMEGADSQPHPAVAGQAPVDSMVDVDSAIESTGDRLGARSTSSAVPFDAADDLWDAERGRKVRGVNASWLDAHAHDQAGWEQFIAYAKGQQVDELVIIDDRPPCGDPIYRDFAEATLSAFAIEIRRNGMRCCIANAIANRWVTS